MPIDGRDARRQDVLPRGRPGGVPRRAWRACSREVQRIKAEGDYAAARALIETYGVHFDPALRDEVVARVEHLDMPSYTAFVMPRLEPVHDGRHDHRRGDHLPARLHRADAGIRGRHSPEREAMLRRSPRSSAVAAVVGARRAVGGGRR